MPEQMAESLKQVALFSDFKDKPEILGEIARHMYRSHYKAGQNLIVQDERGNEYFVLTQGKVVITKKTPEGDSFRVLVLDHHQHPAFGEGGLMGNDVRSATITCETDAECLILNREHFEKMCEQSPHIALPIFKKIAHSLMVRLNQTSNDLMLLHKALMNEIRSQN